MTVTAFGLFGYCQTESYYSTTDHRSFKDDPIPLTSLSVLPASPQEDMTDPYSQRPANLRPVSSLVQAELLTPTANPILLSKSY